MIGLIIGRFQPIHNGHIELIKTATRECESIILVLGSMGLVDEKNPFPRRKEMVEAALKEYDIRNFYLVELPDIANDDEWADYIGKNTPKFDIIYSGDEWDLKLFRDSDFQLKHIGRVNNISSTDIRKMIKNNDSLWRELVPQSIIEFIS